MLTTVFRLRFSPKDMFNRQTFSLTILKFLPSSSSMSLAITSFFGLRASLIYTLKPEGNSTLP